MAVLKSAGLFGAGILHRFWLWMPALIFDPFDLYDRIIKPQLPEKWRVDIPFPSDFAFYALIALLLWAAILTYHEVRVKLPKASIPNMRIKDAIDYLVNDSILKMRRPPPTERNGKRVVVSGAEHTQARRLLAERIYSGSLDIWGRVDRMPRGTARFYDFDLTPIPKEYWLNARLHLRAVFFDTVNRSQTDVEVFDELIPISASENPTYSGLYLCREQVHAVWPKKSFFKRIYRVISCREQITYPMQREYGTR